MHRITEKELVLPALYAIHDAGGKMSTSDLQKVLGDLLKPTGPDAEILSGRRDTKFSQKVRNLKSHDTLTREGLAEDTLNGFSITNKGRDLVQQNIYKIETLFEFSFDEIAPELMQISVSGGLEKEYIDERTITEGQLKTRTEEYRSRSTLLRNEAFSHYSHNGVIDCHACGFDFSMAYPGLGDKTIQIHHLKPVSYMRGEALSLKEALENVRPLCANCHLIVHKKHPPFPINELKSILQVQYQYTR